MLDHIVGKHDLYANLFPSLVPLAIIEVIILDQLIVVKP